MARTTAASESHPTRLFWTAAGLGAVAGMRTLTPAAVLAHRIARRRLVMGLLDSLAVIELVVDKRPATPDRTTAPALTGRVVSGTTAAALWAHRHGGRALPAGLIGGLGALAGAYAFLALRRRADRALPARTAALLEDALAVGGALAVTRRPPPRGAGRPGR